MANKHPNTSGLIPIKKGEKRNPNGANQFSSQRRFIQKSTDEDQAIEIFKKAVELAKSGDKDLIKWVIEYLYGKTADNLNVKHDLTIEDVRSKLIARSKAKE